MRYTERLVKLRDWVYHTCCEGRLMKTPGSGMDITEVKRQEPKVYLGYYPMRPDSSGDTVIDILNASPSILIMPVDGTLKSQEVQYGDIRRDIHRSEEYAQTMTVQVLFSVYEDGVRLPGFVEKTMAGGHMDMSLIREGTDEGLLLLLNWMSDFSEALLGVKIIPGTDMVVEEHTATFSMYSDQKYISDRRPLYYGFINVGFRCFSNERPNPQIKALLD